MSNRLRVLIVEDSEDDAELLKRRLTEGGYDLLLERVDEAASMEAALETQIWDLVISDYAVPGFDGIAALHLLKKKGFDIPFIIVSGTIDQEIAIQAMKAGASDYVMKDNPARLIPAIERELREAETRREKKQAEIALREAEEQFRSIFENAVEGMFQSTPEGQLLAANPALARMLGFGSSEEILMDETSIQMRLVSDLTRREEYTQLLANNGFAEGFECPAVRKDGSTICVSLCTRLVESRHGVTLHEGTVEDITQRKRLEEQFRQAQKMEAFGQLAAGVAHDFNNILTVIHGNLTLLQMGNHPEEIQNTAIHEALKAAERAANLTRQLLTFGRRQPLQPQDLDLNEIVANTTRLLQRLIGEHITLETRFTPGSAPVHADPGMMEQILMNLAVNSRDAMPKGGKLVIATMPETFAESDRRRNGFLPAGNYIHLTVQDNGTGISPEHLPHIFEPFFTTKEVGKGTGLGLATVFSIVEQHHGTVRVESDAQKGTAFHIYLPRLTQTRTSPIGTPAARSIRGGNETVLVAEDDESVRQLLESLLSRFGYNVHVAASGVAALNIWEEIRPNIDLLVTDMVMPEGVGGRELAERIQAEKPNVKVIYCSGYTDDVLGPDSLLRDDLNFLEKPFDPYKFLQRVRECLDH